jgi:hypothetical protein
MLGSGVVRAAGVKCGKDPLSCLGLGEDVATSNNSRFKWTWLFVEHRVCEAELPGTVTN